MISVPANKSIGQLIAISAAVCVLPCFFFPWIEVEALFMKTSLSGYDLATANRLGPDTWTSLLVVPLAMLAIVIIVGARLLGPGRAIPPTLVSIGVIGAGLASLGVIVYQYLDMDGMLNQNVLGMLAKNVISHGFGQTACILGSIGIVVAGFIDLYIGSTARPRVETAPGQ